MLCILGNLATDNTKPIVGKCIGYGFMGKYAWGSASVLAVHEYSLFNLPRHMRAMSLCSHSFSHMKNQRHIVDTRHSMPTHIKYRDDG